MQVGAEGRSLNMGRARMGKARGKAEHTPTRKYTRYRRAARRTQKSRDLGPTEERAGSWDFRSDRTTTGARGNAPKCSPAPRKHRHDKYSPAARTYRHDQLLRRPRSCSQLAQRDAHFHSALQLLCASYQRWYQP